MTKNLLVFASLAGAIVASGAQAQQGRAPAESSISHESTIRTEPPLKTNPTIRDKRAIPRMVKSFGSKKPQRGPSKAAPL
ncbi:hypothetical protein SLNSH_19715 [Alsobacter soli]|uniref:Uncharacterized protein n=1 Tax=Alsobacter soli TaxID=2109933 RepID=A0A2T1HNQ1_9HYPH|nr:hypothetical protein [Alsobacter soli]PSC03285.1 hypothetical protein SLNSH_19715 [Alsobacter soli]